MINYVVPPKFNPSEIVKEFRKIFEIHGDEFQKFVKKHLIIPSEDKARRTMFVQYISDHQVFLDEIENNEHRHTLPLKELVSNFYGCCNPYRTQAMRKMVGDNDYLKPTNLTLFDMYAYAILKNNSTKASSYCNDYNHIGIFGGKDKCRFLHLITDQKILGYSLHPYNEHYPLSRETVFIQKVIFKTREDFEGYQSEVPSSFGSCECVRW